MKIIIPWYPKELSPNGSKSHWTKISKAKKAYKLECHYSAMQCSPSKLPSKRIPVEIIFIPSSKRRMDLDNCLASCKVGIDTVAEILGIDDSYFRPITIDFGEKDKSNPRIEITFKTCHQ